MSFPTRSVLRLPDSKLKKILPAIPSNTVSPAQTCPCINNHLSCLLCDRTMPLAENLAAPVSGSEQASDFVPRLKELFVKRVDPIGSAFRSAMASPMRERFRSLKQADTQVLHSPQDIREPLRLESRARYSRIGQCDPGENSPSACRY